MNKMLRFTVSMGLIAILFACVGIAQDFRASLTGRVLDASGAAVPGADVQVKNIGTNEVTTSLSDESGNYKVSLLKPGSYTIAVEFPGFKKYQREGIQLNISQAATVDIMLEVGEISEQVTVTGGTPLLESADANRGGVIDNQSVRELPLNSRNPFMLGILVAGVNFNGAAIWQRPFDNGAIAEWTINGSQSRGNEFLLDGAPNNGQAGGNNIAYVPPVDSVEEFKIMTNTYDAQYGKTTGGIINVSLRSGTNDFHGTVYEFARRNRLDANDFRNKARGRRADGSEIAPRSGHYLDQYGFQLQGPVYIPKIYNGKNKTFFMFNYEGYREGVPSPLTLSVPEPEMLTGDFSKLVDGQGRPIIIYDPFTGVADSTVPGGWRRTAFPGNIIPANRINPISAKILSFMPKPNTKSPANGYSRSNLFLSPQLALDDFYNWVLKIDQNIGEKHRFFVRYAANDRTEDRNTNGVLEGPGQDGQQPFKRINDAASIDHVSTLSPSFILNLRVSFGRFEEDGFGRGNVGFDKTSLGFQKSLVDQLPAGPLFGRYEFSDYVSLGRNRSRNITNTVAFHPNITKIRGAHSIKAGVDMRWTQYITQNAGNPFRLEADRRFTQRQYNSGDSLSGNSIATFLLGVPTAGVVDFNLFPTTLFPYYAPWFQDDWKVNSRLTLNLGLRWDFNVPPNERYNRLNRGFDAEAINPIDKLIDRTKFPTTPTLKGGIKFAGINGNPRIASDIDWNNIQPRIGAAYLLRNKVVLRAGWGVYYVNPSNDYLQFNGFSQATSFVRSNDGDRTPREANSINNPFPGGILQPSGSSLGLLTFMGRGFNFDGENFVVPYVHQFSLGFQFEMPWQSKAEISYVGNRTRKLQTTRPFNEPDLAFRQKCNVLEGGSPAFCNERLPNPFQGIEAFRGTTAFTSTTLSRFDLARPYPQFVGGITEQTRNDGAIYYNALQVTVEKRAKRDLNMTSTYTFSKQIERWGFNDVQRNVMQQGLYLWDRPHRFTVGSVYQLPFGPGRRFFNSANGVVSRIIGGWENTVILQWQSGRPWEHGGNYIQVKEAKVDNVDWHAHKVFGVRTSGTGATQAACVAAMNDLGVITLQPFSVAAGCTDYDFLRTANFAPRFTPFRDGRIRRHAIPIWDFSLNKMTRITEGTSLQLRFESFNLTNSYQFGNRNFNNNPNDANFGSMFPRDAGNTETTYPRHIQLAVKFIW